MDKLQICNSYISEIEWINNLWCNFGGKYDTQQSFSTKKLIEITNQGLMLKAIALNVGVDVNDLSRFKSGMECLKQSDVEILSEYLNEVRIPQWKKVVPEKQKSTKLDLLCMRMKKRSTVSKDLLNELES